jgi:hypothetical protein
MGSINITLTDGYAMPLLKSISQIAGEDDPQYKITPSGFTKMLLKDNRTIRDARVLQLNLPTGQQRRIFIKYQNRYSVNAVEEQDNCDIDVVPSYLESELVAPRVAKLGIYISFADLQQFQEDAIATVELGKPATKFMQEHVYSIMRAANAIISKIDQRLLGDIVWGNNAAYSLSNAAQTININRNAMVNDLNTGLAQLLTDAYTNEMWGDLQIMGSGLFQNYEFQKVAAGLSASGVDVSKFTGYEWFGDLNAASVLGQNMVGVFSAGAVGFVDLNQFIGQFSGELGISTLFQMALPVATGQNDGTVPMVTFDAQLKPIDCPTVLLNGYGDQVTYDKGYALFITKNYGLWQIPSDAYGSDDRLNGVNGSLLYTIENVDAD